MVKFSIYLVAMSMGACGLAYEYNFSKLSSDLLGNSERQWALVIGFMMFAMGVGAEYQKRITNTNLIYKFSYLEIGLSALGGWGPIFLFWVFGEARDYYILSQFALTFIVGLLIGMEIPLLTRLNGRFIRSLKMNLGDVMSTEYVGAFIGTILWVFVLLGNHSIFQISILVALFNLLACLPVTLTIVRLKKPRRPKKIHSSLIFAAFPLMCVALSASYFYSPSIEGHFEQKLFTDPIIYSKTTKHQHIVLTRSPAGEVLCYINGNLQFSSYDEHIYHEYLVHPAMGLGLRPRKNILILGGGDGLALREVLKYPQVDRVTLVDIDSSMTDLASSNEVLLKLNKGSLLNSKVQHVFPSYKPGSTHLSNGTNLRPAPGEEVALVEVLNIDARQFLEEVPGYYDVIIIDFPDPNSVNLAKLYSLTFYRQLKKRLSAGGIVVQQSTSPYRAKEAFLCIGRTWEQAGFEVIPLHENVPSFGEWGWWIGGDKRYYSKEYLSRQLGELKQIEVDTQFINPTLIKASLVFGKNILKSEYNTYNTIINNVVYKYYESSIKQFR